jgi:deazaflavin-dependent oxidoreductase (nitroreductase family)
VLTVTGRTTGAARHLPVVVHELGDRTYLWCPYGSRARWFPNVVANPLVTVQSHRGTRAMRAAKPAGPEEVQEMIADLRQFDETFLRSYLASEGVPDTPDGVTAHRDRLHLRWLEPTDEVGPPGLPVDLRWVWSLPLLGLLLAVVRARRRA